MFINITKFKQKAKASYEGLGLIITHHKNGIMQVSGGGMILAVDTADITKKCMAALVELVGPLPEAGEGYLYMKDQEKQELPVEESESIMLMENFTRGKQVQDTRIMIQRYGRCYDVFQQTDTKEPFLIPRDLHVIIDPEKVDKDHKELRPEMPVKYNHMIIYNNDTMQIGIAETPVHNSGERDFLRLINGKDMAWPFED